MNFQNSSMVSCHIIANLYSFVKREGMFSTDDKIRCETCHWSFTKRDYVKHLPCYAQTKNL